MEKYHQRRKRIKATFSATPAPFPNSLCSGVVCGEKKRLVQIKRKSICFHDSLKKHVGYLERNTLIRTFD